MARGRFLIVTACALLLMLMSQAAWESPLRPFVWWWTTPGCWFAWHVATPDYNRNSTVWLFDTIATLVNTVVYVAAAWLARMIWLAARKQTD